MGKAKVSLPFKRVLIVDDDASIELLWQVLLKKIGIKFKIDWVTNEVDATAMIAGLVGQGLFYDLVITDIFLSGSGTGLDLWKKATPSQRSRFVIISAADQDKIVEHLKDQYSQPKFLRKPLDLDESMKLVIDIFKLGSMEESPAKPSVFEHS